MYRRIFSQKQKLVALAFVAFLGIILSGYTYHGLHYDANSRTVSFYVESLKAGCELTVGIITQTPETVDNSNSSYLYTSGRLLYSMLTQNLGDCR